MSKYKFCRGGRFQKSKKTTLTVDTVVNIIDSIVTDYDVWENINSRKLPLVWRRSLYYYFLYKYTSLPLESVGGLFEGKSKVGYKQIKSSKDHATVLHGLKQLEDVYLLYDPQIKSYYDAIESRIKASDGFLDDDHREESIAEKMIKHKRSSSLFKTMFRRQTMIMVDLKSENIRLKQKIKELSGGLRQDK